METTSATAGATTTKYARAVDQLKASTTVPRNVYARMENVKVDVTVDSGAAAPADKLNRLLSANRKFAQLWNSSCNSGEDGTISTTETATEKRLTRLATRAGWSDQEVADLLAERREKAGDAAVSGRENEIENIIKDVRKQEVLEGGLREVAGQFAGFFLGEFMKSMRDTVETGEFGHGGKDEQTWQGMLDSELANAAATTDSYGLNELIYSALARKNGIDDSADSVPVRRSYGTKFYPNAGTTLATA